MFSLAAHPYNRRLAIAFDSAASFLKDHVGQHLAQNRPVAANFRSQVFDVTAPKPRIFDNRHSGNQKRRGLNGLAAFDKCVLHGR